MVQAPRQPTPPQLVQRSHDTLQAIREDLLDDFALPDDVGEDEQQPRLIAALNDALNEAGHITSEALVVSNFALSVKVIGETVVKAPDWLYVPRINPPRVRATKKALVRRSYTPNLEGEPVAVVMEFLSHRDNGEYSLWPTYPYGKLFFYETILQVPSYVIFNPATEELEVKQHGPSGYETQQPNAEGRYWIPALNLFLGTWRGEWQGVSALWLRWWTAEGELLLWSAEQRAVEAQRAEQEAQRAEQEVQRAEQEAQRAEQEAQRAERLAAKLRELGLDPNAI